jgi:hypothetical protein
MLGMLLILGMDAEFAQKVSLTSTQDLIFGFKNVSNRLKFPVFG